MTDIVKVVFSLGIMFVLGALFYTYLPDTMPYISGDLVLIFGVLFSIIVLIILSSLFDSV